MHVSSASSYSSPFSLQPQEEDDFGPYTSYTFFLKKSSEPLEDSKPVEPKDDLKREEPFTKEEDYVRLCQPILGPNKEWIEEHIKKMNMEMMDKPFFHEKMSTDVTRGYLINKVRLKEIFQDKEEGSYLLRPSNWYTFDGIIVSCVIKIKNHVIKEKIGELEIQDFYVIQGWDDRKRVYLKLQEHGLPIELPLGIKTIEELMNIYFEQYHKVKAVPIDSGRPILEPIYFTA